MNASDEFAQLTAKQQNEDRKNKTRLPLDDTSSGVARFHTEPWSIFHTHTQK